MKIAVRPAQYGTEAGQLIDVLQKNLPYLPHAKLFEWLYLHNPAGIARCWVAEDEAGEIIGIAAAFPRVLAGSPSRTAYVLGDFGIDPRHRSLGLAVKLQKALLEDLATTGCDFVFDFPSASMMSVYKRIGLDASHSMVRYARALRVDRYVGKRIPVAPLARSLSAVANAGLQLRGLAAKTLPGYTFQLMTAPWTLDCPLPTCDWQEGRTHVARTPEYLQWRYAHHPTARFEMCMALRSGTPAGYAVFHGEEDNYTVDDLTGEGDDVRTALLNHVAAAVHGRGAHTISIGWLGSDTNGIFEASGFRARENSPVVLLARSKNGRAGFEPVSRAWRLTNGDTES